MWMWGFLVRVPQTWAIVHNLPFFLYLVLPGSSVLSWATTCRLHWRHHLHLGPSHTSGLHRFSQDPIHIQEGLGIRSSLWFHLSWVDFIVMWREGNWCKSLLWMVGLLRCQHCFRWTWSQLRQGIILLHPCCDVPAPWKDTLFKRQRFLST